MRYVWITIGVAVLHRCVVIGIVLLGFCIAMAGFGSSNNSFSSLGLPIMGLAAAFDFPLVLAGQAEYFLKNKRFPTTEHWGEYGIMALKTPFLLQGLWSLCVGMIIAYGIYRYRLQKYGPQPPIYWK